MTTPTPQFGNAEAIEKEIMNKMLDMYMKKWIPTWLPPLENKCKKKVKSQSQARNY